MRKKVYRITLPDGKTKTYKVLKELYEAHKDSILITLGALNNALSTQNGRWCRRGVVVERYAIVPAINVNGTIVQV